VKFMVENAESKAKVPEGCAISPVADKCKVHILLKVHPATYTMHAAVGLKV